MSCCWNITWLGIYLAMLFLLSSCYSLLLSNPSVFLFLLHFPSKFMINKEKKHFSAMIWVLCNVILWNNISQDFFCTKKLCLSPAMVVTLVNFSLISQSWENASSFNFLANTLQRDKKWCPDTVQNYQTEEKTVFGGATVRK